MRKPAAPSLTARVGGQVNGDSDGLEAELDRLRRENRSRLRRRVAVILVVLLTAAGVQ